jgi:hypothetical protein
VSVRLRCGWAVGTRTVFATRRARLGPLRPAPPASSVVRCIKFGGRHVRNCHDRDRFGDKLFDRRDRLAVLGRRQGKGATPPACPTGASDAVDIVLGMVRHVEIEDVRQALNIEPARRDIAGNQQPDLAILEALQSLGAFRLRHVAVQRRRIEPVPGQRAIKNIDVALAIAEDQRIADMLARDQPAQCLALFARLYDDERLLDSCSRRGRRRHRDLDRVVQERVGQAADFRRHRR